MASVAEPKYVPRSDAHLYWLFQEDRSGRMPKLGGFASEELFSATCAIFFLIKCVILVYEKLPVASPFRSFNSMMQRAPRLESGITIPTWPEPSFPSGPAGRSVPQGDPGPQPPSEEEAGPARTSRSGGVWAPDSPSQGTRGCLEMGVLVVKAKQKKGPY